MTFRRSLQRRTVTGDESSGGLIYQHDGAELPSVDEARVEPQPPSCEKDTRYLGYEGMFAYHECECCGRLYAVDAFENTKQFERNDGDVLVIRDTKTHAELASTVSMEVRR